MSEVHCQVLTRQVIDPSGAAHSRVAQSYISLMPNQPDAHIREPQLAGEIGLPCHAVRVSLGRLGQVILPAIAHMNDGHYVVLHELGVGGIVIGDPETGIVSWNREPFAQSFSGGLSFDKV
ncbi:MAG TPA: cysteine peptidase family C39 domain-containing protein [Gemmataceae bacterium]|jgi:ABC-type bacteriocin/lantibiotic exporter with double-glycine peptidase domain